MVGGLNTLMLFYFDLTLSKQYLIPAEKLRLSVLDVDDKVMT